MQIENSVLKHLANTVRFKKNYLRKVDNSVDDHLHAYTLTMKDEDLEYEWRLIEINSRKTMSVVCSIVVVIQDIMWTFLLSKVSWTGKAIKMVLDLVMFFCLYQVYYAAKVKKHKEIQRILIQQDLETQYTKWDIIKFKLAQQEECQRVFVFYQLWWGLCIMHSIANDLEYLFQPKLTDMTPDASIIQSQVNHFMVGINFCTVTIALCLLDVHWIYMGLELVFFCIVQAQQVFVRFPNIFVDYIVATFIIQSCVYLFSYKRIKLQKASFLKTKKIQSLLQEQREIFQHLPDGAVIHRKVIQDRREEDENAQPDGLRIIPEEDISIELRHLNITFQEMFTAYKEKLNQEKQNKEKLNQVKQNKIQTADKNKYQEANEFENSIQHHDEETPQLSKQSTPPEDENSFLRSVYLQKSPYKIKGKVVEQIEDQLFQPIAFIDAIKDFETGQVYSVLTKDEYGTFNTLNQNADFTFAERVANALSNKKTQDDNGYLIYIVTQEVLFNEEISTITYFKDITFGVLYEQVKAQQSLETAISSELQQKIRMPLQNIIQNCKSVENSENLQKYEESNGVEFRNQIMRTRMLSDLMVCQLMDMQDWDEMKNNKFRALSEKFNLPDCLKQIHQMMSIKAEIKNLVLDVHLETDYIPEDVIGDQSRFMRVAINLTTNALNNTQQGKVVISICYDVVNQQIIYKVTDTGIGIKKEEQADLFKIFKSSGKIGMGLVISREMASKFNGKITYESEYMMGSTFAFNFDLEDFNTKPVMDYRNSSIEFLRKQNSEQINEVKNQPEQTDIEINFREESKDEMITSRFNEQSINSVQKRLVKTVIFSNSTNIDSHTFITPTNSDSKAQQNKNIIFDNQIAQMSIGQFGALMQTSHEEMVEDIEINNLNIDVN